MNSYIAHAVVGHFSGSPMMVANTVSPTNYAVAAGPSELGAMAVAVREGRLLAVEFGHRSASLATAALKRRTFNRPGTPAVVDSSDSDRELAYDILDRLQRYAAGEPAALAEIAISVDHLSAFQRRVVQACRAIPRGERRTYAQLAAAAGSPRAARAVGQVMAGNRTPLVVPCHRVVASGGGLGGFSAPEGLAMKRRLLCLESQQLAAAGRS